MSDIKIFVSHRIDLDSETIDNPLYIPVRCGAVYDERENVTMLGDDTGDNISKRRMSFNEFTVQYWAWKNARADYYGMCHYRRYLSFADRRFRAGDNNHVRCAYLTDAAKRRFGLLDADHIAEQIGAYDVVVGEGVDVNSLITPLGRTKTVCEHWMAQDGLLLDKAWVDLLPELIDEFAPEYSASAREYFAQPIHRGYNCFVMKKELFTRLCRLQFPIMFEVERRMGTTGYSEQMKRTPAFLGEMMYGIFVYHLMTRECVRVLERQIVFFEATERVTSKRQLCSRIAANRIDRVARRLLDPFFPPGSARRKTLKKIKIALLPELRR